MLKFRHGRWESADGELGQCSLQWAKLLLGLKAQLETGRGADPIG